MAEQLRCVPPHALIVGWDFSTTAVKALAFDLHGKVVAESRFKNDVWIDYRPCPAPGQFEDTGTREINLMQLEGQARASVRDLAAKLRDVEPNRLGDWFAGGISATHHTAGRIDAHHNPVRRAICWDDQTLAKYHAIGLERLGGPAAVAKLIHGPWAVRYSLSHLVKDEELLPEEDWKRTRWVMGHGPLAAGYLTGRFGVTSVSAAASTGIVNLETDRWERGMLAAISRPDYQELAWKCLPHILDMNEPVGDMAEHLALEAGIAATRRPLIFPTLDDQAAGLVGGGATDDGQLAIILGASAVVNSSSDRFPGSGSLDIMKLNWGKKLWMRCYSNGAQFVEGIEPLSKRIEVQQAASENVPPGCNGTAVLPFEKSEPSIGITKAGLEWHPSVPADTAARVRAAYEAIAYLIALGVREHQDAGQTITRITVSGGMARSKLVCEIIASVLASVLKQSPPLLRLESEEGPALGAAVAALAGLENTCRAEKGIDVPYTIADAVAQMVRFDPNPIAARPEWVEPYRKGLREFEERVKRRRS